jgi:hypothetical protein
VAAATAWPNVQIERDDRQPGRRKLHAKSADAGLAWTTLNRGSERRLRRRRRSRDTPRDDGGWIRHAAAVGIVPGDPKVSIRSGDKTQGVLPELLVRQIEQGPLGDERRPPRPISAAFERQPLQVRNRQAFDPDHVDSVRRPEVDFEAAGLLGGGYAQDAARNPLALRCWRLDEQVWHWTSAVSDEPKIGQPILRVVPFAPSQYAKRRAGGEQAGIDRQPLRSWSDGHHRHFVNGSRFLLREADKRHDRQTGRDEEDNHTLHVAVLGLRTYF